MEGGTGGVNLFRFGAVFVWGEGSLSFTCNYSFSKAKFKTKIVLRRSLVITYSFMEQLMKKYMYLN